MVGVMAQLVQIGTQGVLERLEDRLSGRIGVCHQVTRRLAAMAQALIDGMYAEPMARAERRDERGVELRHGRPTRRRLEHIRADEAIVVEQFLVPALTQQTCSGRLIGEPALLQRPARALGADERHGIVGPAARQQNRDQILDDPGIVGQRPGGFQGLRLGFPQASHLAQHLRPHEAQLRHRTESLQCRGQPLFGLLVFADAHQHRGEQPLHRHIVGMSRDRGGDRSGEIRVAAHVAQARQVELGVAVLRPQQHRLGKRLLGLLQAVEQRQSLTAVECQFEASGAQRARALKSHQRFLGSIHARQHGSQIVVGEAVGRIDLHGAAISGLAIRQPVLFVENEPERGPGFRITGVGVDQCPAFSLGLGESPAVAQR